MLCPWSQPLRLHLMRLFRSKADLGVLHVFNAPFLIRGGTVWTIDLGMSYVECRTAAH